MENTIIIVGGCAAIGAIWYFSSKTASARVGVGLNPPIVPVTQNGRLATAVGCAAGAVAGSYAAGPAGTALGCAIGGEVAPYVVDGAKDVGKAASSAYHTVASWL